MLQKLAHLQIIVSTCGIRTILGASSQSQHKLIVEFPTRTGFSNWIGALLQFRSLYARNTSPFLWGNACAAACARVSSPPSFRTLHVGGSNTWKYSFMPDSCQVPRQGSPLFFKLRDINSEGNSFNVARLTGILVSDLPTSK